MKIFLPIIVAATVGFSKADADQTQGVPLKHHNYSPDPRLLVWRLLGDFVVDVDLIQAFKAQDAKSVTLTVIVKTENGEFKSSKSYERGDTESDPTVFQVPEEDLGLVTIALSVGFGFSGDVKSFNLSELYPPQTARQNTSADSTR